MSRMDVAMTADAAVSVRDLDLAYGGAPVVKSLSLDIAPGQPTP